MTPPKSPYKISAYVKIIRPVNAVMMGLAVIVGEVAISGGIPGAFQMLFGFLVSFFLTASAMVMNDIVDIEIDRINAPDRPLPSGAVSKNAATTFGVLFVFFGVLSAVPISTYAVILAIFTFIISLSYNLHGKKLGLPGNMMVAFCIAVPFLFGGIAVSNTIDVTVTVFFLLAFLASVGREITKGIADIEGDRIKGIKTIALVNGSKTAALGAAIFYILPVLITPIPYIWGNLSIFYLLIVLIVDAGFVYSSVYIMRNQSREAALKVKTQARIWMLLALVAFFVGGITR
ncbi:MAG: UbiA family prenyltransferase [Candidatus Methanomethylicaceae archaeon]|jgi:geranylgeranylglycerol-phosphate geranylgeranyltransferase